jgi:hypothetical protein
VSGEDRRAAANLESYRRLCESEPVLVDVRSAIDVVPGMAKNLVLTSGPPLPWDQYVGGQRDAIIGGARFEGLATDTEDAERKLASGEIEVDACQAHDCVGSVAGIYTASMPVFVVENATFENVGYCNFYEGESPRRLNYGCYDDEVHARLLFAQEVIAPALADAVRRSGGIALKPLMKRALHMGDELHSRNTAATVLFTNALVPALLDVAVDDRDGVDAILAAMAQSDYFFLRLSMAAAKATADAAHGIESSSVVSALTLNCRGFAIRVSGLGDAWFAGPHADVEAQLFEGHDVDEITWMGGESVITETVGLGGFAQAAAFPLQRYQGGSAQRMIERNLAMYDITVGEHTEFRVPYLEFRGTPTGIDVFRVLETGITPVMDAGIAGRDGGQIGAGLVRAPMACFAAAGAAYRARYSDA